MKHYEYAGMDVSTEKSVEDGARCYIEAVRRYLESEKFPQVETIGMGNDRRRVDDSGYRKICLCRTHHTIAHQRGMPSFEKMYHVYGIIVDDSPEGKS